MSKTNDELYEILSKAKGVIVSPDNGSWSYMTDLKTDIQAIQQLIDEAYKKGYIDGGIAELTKEKIDEHNRQHIE